MSAGAPLHRLAMALRRGDAQMAAAAGMTGATFTLYRELLLSNLEAGLAACYPQCKRLLGSDWPVLVHDFLAEGSLPSPAFHECPEAFLRHLLAREGRQPPWLAALAHWEWEELALSLAPWVPTPSARRDFRSWQDRPLLTPTHGLRAYAYAVHRVEERTGPPVAETVYVLRYRDGEGFVRHRELDLAEARLLSALSEGAGTVAAAVARAFPDSPLDDGLRARIANLFRSLVDAEALLGFREDESR